MGAPRCGRCGHPPMMLGDKMPAWVLEGSWSIAAYFYLTFIMVATIVLWWNVVQVGEVQRFADTVPPSGEQTFAAGLLRLLGGVFGLGVVVWVCWLNFAWVITSYTISSWIWLSLRLFCAGLDHFVPSIELRTFAWLMRYPCIVQHSVVFFVWWLVIFPLIYLSMHDNKEMQKGFLKFNSQPFLILVHFFNF